MSLRARFAAILTLVAAAVPAGTAQAGVGPDYVSSDNIELVARIKDVGDGVGAKIVGNHMYVTSTTHLSIFDITDAEAPRRVGLFTLDVEFENEEVPTNGKILGISGQIGCKDPTQSNLFGNGPTDTDEATGCLSLYDVTNPAAPRYIRSVAGAGQHTAACVLDCQYFYGSTGAIVDARDPENAQTIGDWTTNIKDNYCHHVREIRPGYILGSCQPLLLMSVLPEDGGSITDPKVIATGTNIDNRFIHSSIWPRAGSDKFMFAGGETNAEPQCTDTVGAFMVWDTSAVLGNPFNAGAAFRLIDEVRPTNGQYLDGHAPINGLGCSVHWFEEHPRFHDGGALALAEYENGTRLLQITAEGRVVEQGFFLPLAGSTSAPHWHPNGKVIYAIDYARGVDVLRYTGEDYVPPIKPVAPPTGGAGTPAPCAAASGFDSVSASALRRGLRFSAAQRGTGTFDVEVLQVSSGRTVLRSARRVARFADRSGLVDWDGKGARDGRYVIRFKRGADVRTLAYERRNGTFRPLGRIESADRCGAVSSLDAPVFGGRTKDALKVRVRLAAAGRMTVEALVGKKVVRRTTRNGRSAAVSLPSTIAKAGRRVRVRVTTRVAGKTTRTNLSAVRL